MMLKTPVRFRRGEPGGGIDSEFFNNKCCVQRMPGGRLPRRARCCGNEVSVHAGAWRNDRARLPSGSGEFWSPLIPVCVVALGRGFALCQKRGDSPRGASLDDTRPRLGVGVTEVECRAAA